MVYGSSFIGGVRFGLGEPSAGGGTVHADRGIYGGGHMSDVCALSAPWIVIGFSFLELIFAS